MVFSFLKLLSKDRWRVFLFNDNYSNTLSLCVVSRFSYMKYIVRKMFSILFTGVIHVIIKVFYCWIGIFCNLEMFLHIIACQKYCYRHSGMKWNFWHADTQKKFKVLMMLEMTFYWYDYTLCFSFKYNDELRKVEWNTIKK